MPYSLIVCLPCLLCSRSESLLSLYRIGSVRLYLGVCFRLRRPHRTGIGAPFAFRSPASAPSVGASGGAGWSAPVGLVGSGYCLHTPSFKCGGWNFGPPLLCFFLFPFCFIFYQLLFLHWHYSPSFFPWFFFFISPFLITKNTFLSFLTFPHPSLSIFL